MKNNKTRGLGRGLDALMGDSPAMDAQDWGAISQASVHLIDPYPGQPRKRFDRDALEALASSMREHGVLQPLIVERGAGGRYRIVAGERRWRAARIAGLEQVPVIVRDIESHARLEIALIENIQREDLNPVEEALAFRALIEEHGLTQEALCERVGRSRPAISNALRLLTLPRGALELIEEGKLTAGQARALVALECSDADKEALARRIVEQGLSARQVEQLARDMSAARPARKKTAPPRDPGLDELSEMLQRVFSTRVQTKGNDKKGRIVIEYYSRDDLERIYQCAQRLADG